MTPQPTTPDTRPSPATFVLIHGAWHGGWCWRFVSERLVARGHRVFAPTLTGQGERRHLLNAVTSLDVPVADIENLIEAEELDDVVLVGHSYGGLIASGVADRKPDALRALVFLDSLLVENGEAAMDVLPRAVAEERLAAVAASGQTLAMPVPDGLGGTGIPDDHPLAPWVRRRLTPHPLATYQTPLALRFPIGNGLPCTYVHCANPSYDTLAPVRERVRQKPGWHWETLDTGHDAMVLDPDLLVALLERLAACAPSRKRGDA
ncbi:alpha/beta fold hydrolase [Paraburkholderia caballeronis]|uniref:alpha/beta fold hydrolase n=1 Tax=Paraburkholderia caballeronis TaxID=416943 RepID=UPI0010646FCE|nr:alpha/beta hydrolase [Paraburkholderia caballeronis]TDV11461.1 pimeloyl-ACP methyl ester carboxylesterase [Paraburkholderia caballeronis]TDV14651.1 pimeloyl-ACP methyl ester carboxylesterase [Paraburkholderia caballeronis]TDV23722.1 pimeloyl-ACP methyl ester carboxylesterase [Paraburkholderia caballeronis]